MLYQERLCLLIPTWSNKGRMRSKQIRRRSRSMETLLWSQGEPIWGKGALTLSRAQWQALDRLKGRFTVPAIDTKPRRTKRRNNDSIDQRCFCCFDLLLYRPCHGRIILCRLHPRGWFPDQATWAEGEVIDSFSKQARTLLPFQCKLMWGSEYCHPSFETKTTIYTAS